MKSVKNRILHVTGSSFPRRQSGFSLIEVLVSTIVLSIGLIGIASLQAASLSNNQSLYMRSQATAMAYDMADRMRANVSSATASLYDPANKALSGGCSSTSGCTPTQMALHDLAEWDAALTANLPMGQGFVCRDSTPNDGTSSATPACDGNGTQFVVKIWWDDNRDGVITVGATDNERFVITYQL